MHIVKRWRGQTRRALTVIAWLGLLRARVRLALLLGERRGRRARALGLAGRGQRRTVLQVLERSLNGSRMVVDSIGHHGPVGRGQLGGGSARRSGGRPIGSRRVAVGRADAVGACCSCRRLRRGRVAAKPRALEQMLLLARGVLCANLLAVDALDGQTLICGSGQYGLAVTK